MKKIYSLLTAIALLSCIGVGAFAFDGYVIDGKYAVKDVPSLNAMADDIYNSTGIVISCFIGNSDDSASGHEQGQKLFIERFGDAEGMMLIDRLDDEKLYFYCTSDVNSKMTQDASMALLQVYNDQYDYDSAVREYILTGEKMLEAMGYTAEATDAPVIPENRQVERVVDMAGVLSASELKELNAMADSVSEQYKCDVCLLLVNGTDGKEVQAYADDYYDYNGCGYGEGDDGILFVIDVKNREFAISTYGYGITAFTDYGQQYLDSKYLPELQESYWEDAAEEYIEGCSELLYMARNSQPYDVTGSANSINPVTGLLGFNLLVGFLISFIIVGVKKKKHKSVEMKPSANEHVRPGSFYLSYRNNRFIRKQLTKVKKPEPKSHSSGGSSTHISSSGRSHGGHSGKF